MDTQGQFVWESAFSTRTPCPRTESRTRCLKTGLTDTTRQSERSNEGELGEDHG